MKIITKKYKVILLGESFSGKTFLLDKLKCLKNKNKIIQPYSPTDGINFYKYFNNKKIRNSLSKKNELHETILYLYDSSGSRKIRNFLSSYINESQICLLVINPNQDNIKQNFDFWLDLYITHMNRNTYNIVFVVFNDYIDNKNENTQNTIINKMNNQFKNREYINNLLKTKNQYINNYFIGTFDFSTQTTELMNAILQEIHNNNILNIMNNSPKIIKNSYTNYTNDKLYFKKEVNYNNDLDFDDINHSSNKNIDQKTNLLDCHQKSKKYLSKKCNIM